MKSTSQWMGIKCALIALALNLNAADVQKQIPLDLERELRHELTMLTQYGVFDYISFHLDGERVVLTGQVTHSQLKQDAERAVRAIKGILKVENEIEQLPSLADDDQVRHSVYRAVYGDQDLCHYSYRAFPSIHIVVKNGSVTLVGSVATQTDRALAALRAQTVGGVVSVRNELRIGI